MIRVNNIYLKFYLKKINKKFNSKSILAEKKMDNEKLCPKKICAK